MKRLLRAITLTTPPISYDLVKKSLHNVRKTSDCINDLIIKIYKMILRDIISLRGKHLDIKVYHNIKGLEM